MSESAKAVFLSYAREDADAAKRIAEALRGFGVEVWFDQNELRGGDQWDARIRGQIKTCALFIPIISATTQARDEAYFRLEWKLADDRSQLMAPGKPFIVPVVIDATSETGATVPESFARAQWTRLGGGEPTPAFIEHVKRLLEGPRKPALKPDLPRPPTLPPEFRQGARKSEGGGQSVAGRQAGANIRRPAWTWAVVAIVVVAAVAAAFFIPRKSEPAGALVPVAKSPAPEPPPPVDVKSIAVLPFANLSSEKENEFFADGMHDDLITALAKIRDLKVISRTSVMTYKNGERNLRKIAAELGVATVLEGSVQRAGNKVRLNVQLIDARTDGHLWAETYSKDITDVFTMQAALTQEIATALKASLTPGERSLIARRPTENQQAYDLYLRARLVDQSLQIFSSRVEYERAVALYEEAAALDPAFTLAHVQASISHGTMYWFAPLDPTPERRARALASLEKARALGRGSPEVRLAEGSFEYTCNNDWRAALEHYRAAESSLPNDAQLQYRMALAHRRLGEMGEALIRLERCAALNPNDARSLTTLVETLYVMRRYPAVVARVDQERALFAADYNAQRFQLGARQENSGDWAAFLRGLKVLPPRSSDPHGLDLAYATALHTGDLAQADRLLQDSRWQVVAGLGGIVNEPVALHRAQLAWLLGRPDEARRFADEAIAYYRAGSWNTRQRPVAQMGIARAEAFAGRAEAAIREGRAALAAQESLDKFNVSFVRHWLGGVLIVTGRPDDALGELRRIMAGLGSITAGEFRHYPIWSRLKDDPRFEEILKTAKPL
jgi:TolB-like protein